MAKLRISLSNNEKSATSPYLEWESKIRENPKVKKIETRGKKNVALGDGDEVIGEFDFDQTKEKEGD